MADRIAGGYSTLPQRRVQNWRSKKLIERVNSKSVRQTNEGRERRVSFCSLYLLDLPCVDPGVPCEGGPIPTSVDSKRAEPDGQ